MIKLYRVDSCKACRHIRYNANGPFCYHPDELGAHDIDSVYRVPDWCPLPDDNSEALKTERDALHAILVESVAVVGGSASPASSVEFLSGLPSEIRLLVDGLRARVAELEAITQWRSMESAPIGERILVIDSCGYEPFIAELSRRGEWLVDKGHLYSEDGVIDDWLCSDPIAWMPLPQVPDKTK